MRTPDFEAVHKELAEREIICDFRPDVGLRLGPHFYNTDDELRYTVEQIAEIVAKAPTSSTSAPPPGSDLALRRTELVVREELHEQRIHVALRRATSAWLAGLKSWSPGPSHCRSGVAPGPSTEMR